MSRGQAFERARALTSLGRKMFLDPSLSGSGKMSCASCHSPQQAFGPPNNLPTQAGGKDLRQMGVRAVPSLKYLQAAPQFTEHFFDAADEGNESIDNGPTGGLGWDGRNDRGRDQARFPLLSPYEMANDNPADVVAKVAKAEYAADLRQLFGDFLFCDQNAVFVAVLEALEDYQQDYLEFYPYSSKYDAYLAGKAQLSVQESHGLTVFNDPTKGNCAKCHISKRGSDGTPPQFSDYGFVALGVPRNPAIAANRNSAYFDLGLCGPLRTDLRDRADYCGLFMTPSLRNVAMRHTFFHNGIFHSLRKVLEFYSERDTNPQNWYSRNADGSVNKFDDLPPQYRANVNTEPPFGRRPDGRPALSETEINDMIAFLQTLSDGYQIEKPHSPEASPVRGAN
jgi:cytochrome c peroxidase